MSETFKPVQFNILTPPPVDARQFRNLVEWYGLGVLLVIALSTAFFQNYLGWMITGYACAFVMYIFGYRKEKRKLRTFQKAGLITITATGISIQEGENLLNIPLEQIQKITITKDRPSGSRLLVTRSYLTEHSYTMLVLLKDGTAREIYPEFYPAFGSRRVHKHLIRALETLRKSDYEWYRRIFIDNEVHDVSTL